VRLTDLATLLRESDFVLLHAPQTAETVGMIGEAQLRTMKRTAFLVNVARAPLVDAKALHRALVEGWIAGAALDVYETEPPPLDDPLRSLPNVIRTPHYGGGSVEATERKAAMNLEDIRRALRGEPILHYVNIPGPRLLPA
jgi:phosphoglycerate dehydrogenase-like enzyme